MTIKGYPDQKKTRDGAGPQFATVSPVRAGQQGLDVIAHGYYRSIGTDAVEAGSTTRVINATGHAALKGDVINITSGALDTTEVRVESVAANAITLVEELASVPAAAVTFEILRQKCAVVNDDGGIATTISNDTDTGSPDVSTLRMVEAGRPRAFAPTAINHSTPVTTAAYTQVIASTAALATRIYIGDTSGSFIILAFGAALSEVDQLYLSPGFAGWIDIHVPASTRISIKALDTTTSAGRFVISGLE